MKNIVDRNEKIKMLSDAFKVDDAVLEQETQNLLLVDDLYDTGASLEAAVIKSVILWVSFCPRLLLS